jgi:hypothetical protein
MLAELHLAGGLKTPLRSSRAPPARIRSSAMSSATRQLVRQLASFCQRLAGPIAAGEHTAARTDQYYQSIWVLNAHLAVDAAGDIELILVGLGLVRSQFLLRLRCSTTTSPLYTLYSIEYSTCNAPRRKLFDQRRGAVQRSRPIGGLLTSWLPSPIISRERS